jgi:hypothetical protein
MTFGLRIVLLLFALIGFAGAGAAMAVARHRYAADAENDFGMLAVGTMLLVFGGLCTVVGAGVAGVFAFGGVAVWTSYIVAAQRVGLFRVEAGRLEETTVEEPRQPK